MKSFLLFVSLVISVTCATSLTCNNNADCNYQGQCLVQPGTNVTFCKCDREYATLDNNSTTQQCLYARKSQLTAFLLSLLLGEFGSAFFYINIYSYGVIALIPFIFIVAMLIALCCGFLEVDKIHVKPMMAIIIIFTAIWWIFSIVIFAQNGINDSNNIPLQPW